MKFILFLFLLLLNYIYCDDIPQQIHIAYGGVNENGDSNGMTISWQTVDKTLNSIVKYGFKSGEYEFTASGEQSTYYETWDHHVLLPNLKPSTKYFYICGDDKSGYSQEYSFQSPPSSDSWEYPINMAIIGDMGIYNSDATFRLLRQLKKENAYEFIWHLGDIGYADDGFFHYPLEFTYESAYNLYMNEMQDIVAEIPWMVAVGNHEASCHSPACRTDAKRRYALGNFTAFNHRFKMPYEESGGALNMWTSFNYGPMHLVNIDTETDFPHSFSDRYALFGKNGGYGDQLNWIDNDLKKANENRDQRPWLLVNGHRPIYNVLGIGDDGYLKGYNKVIQNTFEEYFHNHDVDFYMAGHIHSAERSLPIYNYEIQGTNDDAKATIYIVHGAAGNNEGLENYEGKSIPEWNEWVNGEQYGVGIFTLLSDTKCRWTFYSSETFEIMDQVTITRNRN